MSTYIEWQKPCILISALENPAISVPCGFTEGLQIVGRHRDDWSVLQLAYAFEQATKVGRRKASNRVSSRPQVMCFYGPGMANYNIALNELTELSESTALELRF